ncbi:MAG: FecCD family ABC transporter permease [Myxococcota bacterium]
MKRLTPARVGLALAGLGALLLLALAVAAASGPSALSAGEVLAVLNGDDAAGAAADIVWRVRVPRAVLAALVGASLAVSGVLFQALLRNPLADPFVLGVSGGAAVGGIAALALGVGYAAVPPAAFAGAVLTTVVLYAVAGVGGRVSGTHLLLTGVVFNAFASAAIVFLASLAGLTEGASIFLWLIGSLSAARIDIAGFVALFLAGGVVAAWASARNLNLLALGEESAQQLGVDVARQQRVLLVSTSLMVGAAVAVAGLVGFVGLIIPHLLRLALGPDHRLLVPASALGGAAFLVLCDTLARTLLGGRELPVGAITALAGGPLFLYLLRRHHARVLGP